MRGAISPLPLYAFMAWCSVKKSTGTTSPLPFTIAHHWPLSWVMWMQSTPSYPTALRSILILSSNLRLGLPSGLFSSGFPTKIFYAFRISTMRPTCLTHLTVLNLSSQCYWWRVQFIKLLTAKCLVVFQQETSCYSLLILFLFRFCTFCFDLAAAVFRLYRQTASSCPIFWVTWHF
jgi:hypothetical protein